MIMAMSDDIETITNKLVVWARLVRLEFSGKKGDFDDREEPFVE